MREISHLSKILLLMIGFIKIQIINKKFADQIKRAWVENYFKGNRVTVCFILRLKIK